MTTGFTAVLCLPILKADQADRDAVLRKQPHTSAFTPARMAVLKLLASEAAISLENASLYRELAEREARIRQLVDANIIGIFFWDVQDRIVEANDAFLRMVGLDRKNFRFERRALDGSDTDRLVPISAPIRGGGQPTTV